MPPSSRALTLCFFAGSALALTSTAALARSTHKDEVPEAVAVPEGNKLKLSLTGVGVQRYECAAVDGTYTWKFIEPDAALINRRERPAGHHGAGPHWQALDGSQVIATKRAEASVSASSIPWLLLEATSHTGAGTFDDVTFIQRLETEGGLAPDTACAEANSGERVDVPYRALYRFYKADSCDKP